ncbi:MAG: cyclopropane fatty acyl phospholipid synthase [Candidatus Nanopelagicaceae bacterium]
MSSKDVCLRLLDEAKVPVNSNELWSIQVRDERLWDRVIAQHELGLGEAYIDGWWDCEQVDEALTRLVEIDAVSTIKPTPIIVAHAAKSIISNRQTKAKAALNAQHHYDIGNDLYTRMLDKELLYSCGYWENASSLDEAQFAKMDMICQKLQLKPGMQLLDIGSGWGGFLRHAVKNYGVVGTGISLSTEQIKLANERSQGLSVKFIKMDYRDLAGKFDRIVSIGMMEHVGPKNLNKFFAKCDDLLADDGMMLHHTISSLRSGNHTDPFFDRYIFPGGVIPSLARISKATEKKWVIEDVHNFGPDYDRTLMQWYKNINSHWSEIPQYDDHFKRMWNYYLLASAAGFRARSLQLTQLVFRRPGRSPKYVSLRP